MKVWIMCCPNLGSMLKILFNFLHFAKDVEQNHAKGNGAQQKMCSAFLFPLFHVFQYPVTHHPSNSCCTRDFL